MAVNQSNRTNQGFKEHHASTVVYAPVNQVYTLFTHFNDFPKFMSFVKEVTYYDDQRSHWVAEVVGQHEWDAVNENWIESRQICWRSYNGLENAGRVTFQPVGNNQTQVDVYIYYNPPAGILGDAGEALGGGSRFESKLQHDLDNFAKMVNESPPGALDPNSSAYLFQDDSAAMKGTTTDRQDTTMDQTSPSRPTLDRDIIDDQYSLETNQPPTDTESYPMTPNTGAGKQIFPPDRTP